MDIPARPENGNQAASPVAPAKRPKKRTSPSSKRPSPGPEAPQETSPQDQEQHQFGPLPVGTLVHRALTALGYENPTPIQEQVVPLVRSGQDVVGQAQTGTGKTAAFGIPLVEKIDTKGNPKIQALVLVPTRELAVQVSGELTKIGKYVGIRVVSIYGGRSMKGQLEALGRATHVVVATPGRLMDHMERGTVDIGQVRTVVLDEADQMLDIGFADAIAYILRSTPRSRQTLLFSATIPGPIRGLARRYLRDPFWVRVGGDGEPVEQVQQVYYEVADLDRPKALEQLLTQSSVVTQALVFRRTKIGVDWLVSKLKQRSLDIEAIHGDMPQSHRQAVMERFRAGSLRVLVATNVAARGLDIPEVSHVINYDIPDNLEEYVHRIGRTARMGRDGVAITFVSEWDFPMLDAIQAHVGDDLKLEQLAPLKS
ncbi:MAG: DEAD/DEAH box helicase [Dehalococcoidia bacterium]|nr:DEAD/DEAH box helicase [Dehalococcoidia bacterium]